MTMLEVKELTRTFQKKVSVDRISFTVSRGECLAIVGPSGAGKTTLLRMIAGLETPSSGDILLNGASMLKTEASLRTCAMIFQNAALFPASSVRHNIGYGMHRLGYTASETDRLVQEIAGRLHITDLLERMPESLSAGEKQRVGIARALVRKPRVLLLDEPWSNLDLPLRRDFQRELTGLKRTKEMILILVTHDQKEAVQLGDRMMIMKDGRVEMIGRPQELLERPETMFAASFLEEAEWNLLPLKNHPQLKYSAPDSPLVLAIRTEAIVENGPLTGTVVSSVRMGNRWRTEVIAGTDSILLFTEERKEPQSKISFSIPSENVLFFDEITGKAMHLKHEPNML